MKKSKVARFVAVFACAATLAVQLAAAQTHMQSASAVTYTFTGEALEGPEELNAGFHTVTLQNDAESSLEIQIVRLGEGVSAEEIIAAFREVDQAFGEEGDPVVVAINAALQLGDLLGGPTAEGGESQSVGIPLTAGRYIVTGTVYQEGEEDGPPPAPSYFSTMLNVTDGAEAQAPQADVTVRMVDFAFALPPDIRAGEQTWEVVNVGEQIHHLVLMRLQEGKTMDDVMAFMESYEGEPPADEVGHINVLSSGESNYATFDLTPGDYIALCFMPDHRGEATGQPHVALGMMQSFTVAGE
ncbi:MAG: hypothetical protein M3511_13480 [Deinococcota bacterium]|nr:hypothetical protein [Deinococcota bacterium]